MKPRLLIALLGLVCLASLPAAEPAARQPVLVSVLGASAGGWQMKKVAPLLEAGGWTVYRPSLPDPGEPAHLAPAGIRPEDHIQDLVNLIHFEDLPGVILHGHRHGGMVFTGVTDLMPNWRKPGALAEILLGIK